MMNIGQLHCHDATVDDRTEKEQREDRIYDHFLHKQPTRQPRLSAARVLSSNAI